MPVLGICNGFQILCEAGLLPGVLIRNASLRFICRDQWLRVENTSTTWTSRFEPDAEILIPMKNAEGCFVATEDVLDELEGEGRVLFRYVGDGPAQGNPNGALRDIAGICSADGRIAGLMPHPEHAIDPLTGPTDDGLGLFFSVQDFLTSALQGRCLMTDQIAHPDGSRPVGHHRPRRCGRPRRPRPRARLSAARRGHPGRRAAVQGTGSQGRRVRPDPGDPRPPADVGRAGHVLGDVVRALLLQVVQGAPGLLRRDHHRRDALQDARRDRRERRRRRHR